MSDNYYDDAGHINFLKVKSVNPIDLLKTIESDKNIKKERCKHCNYLHLLCEHGFCKHCFCGEHNE